MNEKIYAYADFDFFPSPELIGYLLVEDIPRRGLRYRFEFDAGWQEQHGNIPLCSSSGMESLYSFEISMPFIKDSFPDRWGKNLIYRYNAKRNEKEGKRPRLCTDLDYLLGVADFSRKGGIRFCREDKKYLAPSDEVPVPPISRLGDYIEMIKDYEDNGIKSGLLSDFYSSSSSLGGARPKINIVDNDSTLWIAKVPSRNDTYDVGGWEYLTSILARKAGINMAEARVIRHSSGRNTLLSKRFDRDGRKRIHMASLASFVNEASDDASFLDVAEAIVQFSYQPQKDLKELFRRLVFSAMVNNTDNHLHNHSFLLDENGWHLSPAYDINPSIDGRKSVLSIDGDEKIFSIDVIMETAVFYDMTRAEELDLIDEVRSAVSIWEREARRIGLENEISLMRPAFNLY